MDLREKVKNAVREVNDFPSPGISFKDITPVLQDPVLTGNILDHYISLYQDSPPDCIIGIESRGFLWGTLLAERFKVPFIPVRKSGKLPYETIRQKYDLEYGSAEIEMHIDALKEGNKVLIHDDLLATGGTAAAAASLVEKAGASLYGFSFILELSFLKGRERLQKYSDRLDSIVTY